MIHGVINEANAALDALHETKAVLDSVKEHQLLLQQELNILKLTIALHAGRKPNMDVTACKQVANGTVWSWCLNLPLPDLKNPTTTQWSRPPAHGNPFTRWPEHGLPTK